MLRNPTSDQPGACLVAVVDAVTQTLGFIFSLAVSPVAALSNTLLWLVDNWYLGGLRSVYTRTSKQMRREARQSGDFLRTYLREMERLEREFVQTEFTNLEEAKLGLSLLRLSQTDLFNRARQAASEVLTEAGHDIHSG